MKICTWNVNSIKARKALALEWLKHRNNDLGVPYGKMRACG